MRAVSVLAVLLFHAGLGFPGGFVGVDVFFVISGFLVTSLIFKELENGTFSFARFWERRARRILPAALCMTLAVLVAGWFLLLPEDFRRLGQATVAQSLFSANIYFWRSVNYFMGSAEELPLLHTWSLAVEEQFYFIAPFLLFGLYRLVAQRRRRAMIAVLGSGFLISFFLSVYVLHKSSNAAFYLLPTRAWELLAGSIVALWPAKYAPKGTLLRESLSWLGLAGIFSAMFMYDRETAFPGAAALLPCVGAALVIWANGIPNGASSPSLTSAGRILAFKPLVFIGLISYSLYLWHWPLLAFSHYWAFETLSLFYRIQVVTLSIVLAVLSWRFIETPFRRKQIFGTQRSVLGFAGTGLATMVAAGGIIYFAHGLPQRLPPEVVRFEAAKRDLVPIDNRDAKDVLADNLAVLGKAKKDAPIDFLVWGDSHARAAQPAIELICRDLELNGRSITHSATMPLLGFYRTAKYGLNEEAIAFGEAVFNYVKIHKIPKIFLICRWEAGDLVEDNFDRAFARTVQAFHEIGVRVFVMMQVPSHEFDVPKKLALNALLQQNDASWQTTPEQHRHLNARLYQLAQKLSSDDCVFIDPAPAFLEPSTNRYGVTANGESLYVDNNHLTGRASKAILYGVLKPAFIQ